MREIKNQTIKNTAVTVPGSKSYTHRLLIATALSNGPCTITNALKSEDTLLTLGALQQMGISISDDDQRVIVAGGSGRLAAPPAPIYLANSGTSMRLLTGIAAIGNGIFTLTGSERMGERPIQDLLTALRQLNVSAVSVNNNDCPPLEIQGGPLQGGKVNIDCSISSQYLSSLLLIAPYTKTGLDITVTSGPVSRPYIDMTVDIMEQLGIRVSREGYTHFVISGSETFRAGDYAVEPDCSQASYFWGAAAVTGSAIQVKGVSTSSRQGDVHFAEVLRDMGCRVTQDTEGITVTGGDLNAVEVDMADMPDVVPTLAVVAAFARGKTIIKNVSHLREKESDRIGSVVTELRKMGIAATGTDSGMIIEGGTPRGAVIDTYNDHRMAMSFAIAGLKTPGVHIRNEGCVEKSFPNYWEVFDSLYS
jgi:3-phosphoshikimate 1-carboxyvinyltransferase